MTPEDARAIIQRGEAIAFVGAGLAAPWAGTWLALVEDIAKRCGVVVDPAHLPRVIDECLTADAAGCNAVLRERLPFHNIRIRAAMTYALRLPFHGCLTTNFDPSLRQVSRQEQFQNAYQYPDLPLHDGVKGALYYVHGYFDSRDARSNVKSLVFGERSFREAYGASSLLPGFLLNVLTYRRIVFIGFDPLQDDFAQLIRQSNEIRKQVADSRGITRLNFEHIALWPTPTLITDDPDRGARDLERLDRLTDLQIGTVLYEPGLDHQGLEELLYTWVEQGDLEQRLPQFKTDFDL